MALATVSADRRSRRMAAVEKRFGEPLEHVLRRLYYEEALTIAEVGKRLRVPAPTVAGWMIRLGINRRALADRAARDLAS